MIHHLLQQAEPLAEQQMHLLVEDARKQMQTSLMSELARLQALAAVNPNVRESEITHLKTLGEELDSLLNNTRLKLDAIRYIVVSHQ